MLFQPEFLEKAPLEFITSKKNRKFAEDLQSNGMKEEKIRDILIDFFSFKVILREIDSKADNPEWVEVRAWRETVSRKYDKAIRSLEPLLIDNSIPAGTREVIKKDIKTLEDRRDILTFAMATKPTLNPAPVSIQQMLIFQSCALYEYLKLFNISFSFGYA